MVTVVRDYGDDLANWYNHITKLRALYTLDDKWSVNGSLMFNGAVPAVRPEGTVRMLSIRIMLAPVRINNVQLMHS